MSLTAAGIGSGLDIESLVTQLMVLEQRPLQRIQSQKDDVRVQISANGQLKGAIARFQNAAQALADRDSLGGLSASSSDDGVVSVSATAGADSQSHNITVTNLATHHRLATATVADEDTAIGDGTLDITVDGQTLSLTLASGNNTLAQVRDAINADANNPGVTASIINIDAGSRLILTSNDTGLANAITVTPGGGLAGMAVSEVVAATDAAFTVDGFAVTSASNTVSSVITGVTLELNGAGSASMNFESDSSLVASAAEEFVSSYNSMRGTLKALARTSMRGDSMLLGLERSINARLGNAVAMPDSSEGFLFEAGISFHDNGDLSFNAATLSATMAADPTRVLDLFATDGSGLGGTLGDFLDGYVAAGGIIDARTEGLESRDRALDGRVDGISFRLDKTEKRIRAQFTALDSLLGQLQVTSSFLTQQLLPASNTSRRF